MITENELRRLAARSGVDTMVQDLDYGLGWFLAGFFERTSAVSHLIFKGGTCLRKCYFADYRFSEDLDFTLTRSWSLAEIGAAIETVQTWSTGADGPDFGAEPVRLETVNDDYGQESFQARVYYRGPLRWGGPPRAIQLDISRGETLAFPFEVRRLQHHYSDAERMVQATIPCYSMMEMLTEKLRAIAGQRRFAISRDIHDIYRLVEAGVPLDDMRRALPFKFAAKGLLPSSLTVARLQERRTAFEVDWKRRLVHLLPPDQPVAFETAWEVVIALVGEIQTIE